MVNVAHLPLRPLWVCRRCAAPWPCAPARLTLLREYAEDRVALLVYLGGLLHDAAGELHRLDPHDGPTPERLYVRFLGWAVSRGSTVPRAEVMAVFATAPALDGSPFRSDLDATTDQDLTDRDW